MWEFSEYFERLLRSRNLVISGAGHLVPLFHDAGFINVRVIERILDIGGWREEG